MGGGNATAESSRLPKGTSEEQNYSFGEVFTNTCPAGSSSLSTASECQTAARVLGFIWNGTLAQGVEDHWPKGCFEHKETSVWFNRNLAGKSKESAGPICNATKTTTTLHATSPLQAESNDDTISLPHTISAEKSNVN